MRTTLVTLVALVLSGCSSGGQATAPPQPDAAVAANDAEPELGPDLASPDLAQAETAPADPLIGSWVSNVDENVLAMRFDGTSFVNNGIFKLADSSYGLQQERGTYSIQQGNTLTMFAQASSCQGVGTVNKVSTVVFARQGNNLTLGVDSTTATVFKLSATDSVPAGVAHVGCVGADGTFTSNPVIPVP